MRTEPKIARKVGSRWLQVLGVGCDEEPGVVQRVRVVGFHPRQDCVGALPATLRMMTRLGAATHLLGDLPAVRRHHHDVAVAEPDQDVAVAEPHVLLDRAVLLQERQLEGLLTVRGALSEVRFGNGCWRSVKRGQKG